MRSLRILILGGSSEAAALARALAGRAGIEAILSLAGRTSKPIDLPVATRIGGFGGIAGLAAYLEREPIDLVVDATHPFAEQMSRHAVAATAQASVPLIRLTRPAWRPEPGDSWLDVPDMATAAHALGREPRRVFLTVGRLQLGAFAAAPWHHYVVRTIDPVETDHGLPDAVFVEARGPFSAEAEEILMRNHRIDVLVSKNSGGSAAIGKLQAARRLALPVILVRRPNEPVAPVEGVAAALDLIEAHRAASAPRGV